MIKQPTSIRNLIVDLQDYMFTSTNMNRYTKHMIQLTDTKPKSSLKHIKECLRKSDYVNDNPNNKFKTNNNNNNNNNNKNKNKNNVNAIYKPERKQKMEPMYQPKQKDSLFWCFYILKNGFSNYEMEIINQYFVVEKTEKFKYIELIRKNKDLLKLHKIKPFTEIEDDLANKDKISIKTFFALCVLEEINILLVNKRKVYELLSTDIDTDHPIHIVHRNNQTYEHFIELEPTDENITKYRDTYYKMSSFDATLKSIGSYKLEELTELCKKLDIHIESASTECKKKLTKKDIYELLVLNY
jgi:hypothetical protein